MSELAETSWLATFERRLVNAGIRVERREPADECDRTWYTVRRGEAMSHFSVTGLDVLSGYGGANMLGDRISALLRNEEEQL